MGRIAFLQLNAVTPVFFVEPLTSIWEVWSYTAETIGSVIGRVSYFALDNSAGISQYSQMLSSLVYESGELLPNR